MREALEETLRFIRSKTDFQPEVAIILGTGLGRLLQDITIELQIPYSELPHFPEATVEFHEGKLLFGHLDGKGVVVMRGRYHYYEGYTMQQVTFPVRVMKSLGASTILISNAAGGINPDFELGDLMVIEDHINLHYENPLTGKNIEEWGPRFPDLYHAYNPNLVQAAMAYGEAKDPSIKKGVYVSVPGPNLETPAEYRYLRTIGADAVGMSTVPEVLVARHMGLRVFAVSVITDLCFPEALKPVDIKEILATAASAEPNLAKLFAYIIKDLPHQKN